ncbi:hypothetical protein BSPWISOXPB_7831 [uncultured Gammaproteobacteria bacterium]|nr:hypothetical protein BSPWISOXPB_7831 [uncultured Gammaproteobacteria bacterium]
MSVAQEVLKQGDFLGAKPLMFYLTGSKQPLWIFLKT